MRRAALLPVVAVIFLVGCTPTQTTDVGGFEGTERAVAQVVADLSDAGTSNEPADICGGLVTDELREAIAAGGSDCNAEMLKAIEDADGFEFDVEDVEVTGENATARVTSTDNDRDVTRTFEFQRVDGDWRISSFG